MDASGLDSHLCGESGPRRGMGVVAQDPAWDRLTLDVVHDESVAETVAGIEQPDDLGDRHPGAVGGPQHLVLGGTFRLTRPGPGVAPQDQPLCRAVGARFEGPRLTRRTPGNAPQARHLALVAR